MKLILIARVSDKEQRKALPAQKLRLENYAKSLEYKQGQWEYKQFDESAYKEDRQKFSLLIEDKIQSLKEPAIIVFDKIDRFTRDASQKEVRIISSLVEKGKIELHFPSDNLVITRDSPATDKFRLGIGMLLAKYYSDASRDNVKRRFEQMLNDGLWVGCAPLGYINKNLGTIDKPNKVIEIDDLRAHHVVRMFEKRALGLPYAQIAKEANADGLRSKKGKQLNKSAVEKILRNPFYYGEMLYMGEKYEHKYPPLITKRLFDACQRIREQRHDVHTAYASKEFTFREIVKCKVCGCTVSSFKARNGVYMKCSGAKGKCGNMNTAQSLVMPDILNLVSLVPPPEGAIDLIVGELKKRHNHQQKFFDNNLEQVRKEYDGIKARLKNLTYERLDGRIPAELYEEMVTELTARQKELEEKMSSLTDSNKSFMVTASYLLDLAQKLTYLFENSSERLQQKLLKFVLSNIELFDKRLTYIVNDPYKTFIELNKKALDGPNSANWCGSGDSNPWPRPWQGRALNN